MPKKLRITKKTTDDQLLNTRICDLGIRLEGSKVHRCIKDLLKEMKLRGFNYKPYFWLSDEFFTPDGVPGIAVPFYLAHPRLEKLERKQMFEAEGSQYPQCMRILRHELGHAIDHAYHLVRRKRRQKLFGRSSVKYPESYSPKPFSRSYVIHLENWYAQAHPDEDFAETFAVWFKPGSRWRARYKKWPAIKKLEYMDELMNEVREKRPPNRVRRKEYKILDIKQTLGEHYQQKKEHYGLNTREDIYDRELKLLFSNEPQYKKNRTAASFIRGIRSETRQCVGRYSGQYQYSIDEILEEVIQRCSNLGLRLVHSEERTKDEFMVLIGVLTMSHTYSGGFALAV